MFFAALVLLSTAPTSLAANVPPADPRSAANPIQTPRDFKRLRARAKTPEDFIALATYCEAQVNHYQEDKARNEAELKAYYEKPRMSNYKFRQLDETLKIYITSDEKAVTRWSQLADQFHRQARQSTETPARP